MVGVSYNGNDIKAVQTGGIEQCCKTCAATAGCNAWSYCNIAPPLHCGDARHGFVDCYLKTKAENPAGHMDARVSGIPGTGCKPTYPPALPSALPSSPTSATTAAKQGSKAATMTATATAKSSPTSNKFRFFNLIEDMEAGILARMPKAGSGYVKDIGCTNTNTEITCPKGVLPTNLSTADMSMYANLGADWFTETRQATRTSVGADGSVSVTFETGHFNSANNKVFVQGSKEFITEAGEWALDSEAGVVYLWPRDQATMAAGKAVVTMATTIRVLDILGEGWDVGNQATAIDFSGIVFSGSDFSSHYLLFQRTNDTPVEFREGMIRIENATDVTVKDCAVLDAGHSVSWPSISVLSFYISFFLSGSVTFS